MSQEPQSQHIEASRRFVRLVRKRLGHENPWPYTRLVDMLYIADLLEIAVAFNIYQKKPGFPNQGHWTLLLEMLPEENLLFGMLPEKFRRVYDPVGRYGKTIYTIEPRIGDSIYPSHALLSHFGLRRDSVRARDGKGGVVPNLCRELVEANPYRLELPSEFERLRIQFWNRDCGSLVLYAALFGAPYNRTPELGELESKLDREFTKRADYKPYHLLS